MRGNVLCWCYTFDTFMKRPNYRIQSYPLILHTGACESVTRYVIISLRVSDLEGVNPRHSVNNRSALQDLQLRATECSIEREKLTRVVNSFGGHSLQELTTESQQLERRALEAEKAVAEAHMIANEKAAEALDALERAADLGEALDKETAAKVVAEDSKRTLTQDLRACLRNRAKAEEAASVASRALTKSEAQRESLGQRLEVLRAENKRLVKMRSAAAGVARVVGASGGAETGKRLSAARARLRSLSVCNLNSASGGGCGNKGDAEMAAIERAMKAAAVEKRWEEKLHKAKARGEAYKTTAEAAEAGMQRAVREKVELEKVNRVLAKKLDERSRDAASGRVHRHSGKTVAASGKRDSGASGAANLHEQDAVVPDDQASASESDLPARTGGANDTDIKKCPAKARFLDATGLSPPTHRSSDLAWTDNTAAAVTAAPSGRTHVGGFAAQATTSRERETQTLPLGTRLQTARSYSADGVCVSGLSFPNGRHHARPCSTSKANPLSDHGALDKASEEPIKTLSDNYAAPYDQLLLQSRQLREESLSAVRQGPWGDKTQAICSAAPTPQALQPQLQPEVQTQGTLRANCNAGAQIDPVASVPIDVLLRLCDRSAHGRRGETSEDITLDAINRATTCSQVVEEDMEEQCEGLGINRGLPQPVTQPGGVHYVVLPAGISATLAEQVRRDERPALWWLERGWGFIWQLRCTLSRQLLTSLAINDAVRNWRHRPGGSAIQNLKLSRLVCLCHLYCLLLINSIQYTPGPKPSKTGCHTMGTSLTWPCSQPNALLSLNTAGAGCGISGRRTQLSPNRGSMREHGERGHFTASLNRCAIVPQGTIASTTHAPCLKTVGGSCVMAWSYAFAGDRKGGRDCVCFAHVVKIVPMLFNGTAPVA